LQFYNLTILSTHGTAHDEIYFELSILVILAAILGIAYLIRYTRKKWDDHFNQDQQFIPNDEDISFENGQTPPL